MQRLLVSSSGSVGRRLFASSSSANVVPVNQSYRPSTSQTERKPAVHATPEDKLAFDQDGKLALCLDWERFEVTHTGQAWDASDYRLARFTEVDKHVNPNVAMHLVAAVAPTAVASRIASCDGGGGALGHPKVYINLDKPGNHACGYCGLRFFQEGHHHDGSEHIQV